MSDWEGDWRKQVDELKEQIKYIKFIHKRDMAAVTSRLKIATLHQEQVNILRLAALRAGILDDSDKAKLRDSDNELRESLRATMLKLDRVSQPPKEDA